jgi:DNA-binding NtrC family response regulator
MFASRTAADMQDPLRVLMVEDDVDYARTVQAVLEQGTHGAPIQLTLSHSLSDALQHLVDPCPDAVLLDLHLGDSGGLETLLAVLRRCPHTAVAVITGMQDRDLELRLVQAGAGCVLHKGATLDGHAIRSGIDRAIIRRERERLTTDVATYVERLSTSAQNIEEALRRLERGRL